MNDVKPLEKTKEQLTQIIEAIGSEKSPVGIDAQYTHAIIINYLQQISERLDTLEKAVNK